MSPHMILAIIAACSAIFNFFRAKKKGASTKRALLLGAVTGLASYGGGLLGMKAAAALGIGSAALASGATSAAATSAVAAGTVASATGASAGALIGAAVVGGTVGAVVGTVAGDALSDLSDTVREAGRTARKPLKWVWFGIPVLIIAGIALSSASKDEPDENLNLAEINEEVEDEPNNSET